MTADEHHQDILEKVRDIEFTGAIFCCDFSYDFDTSALATILMPVRRFIRNPVVHIAQTKKITPVLKKQAKAHRLVASCQFHFKICNKSVKSGLLQLVICSLIQLVASLWTTSFDNLLAKSLQDFHTLDLSNSMVWILSKSMDLSDINFQSMEICNYYRDSKSILLSINVHTISILGNFLQGVRLDSHVFGHL